MLKNAFKNSSLCQAVPRQKKKEIQNSAFYMAIG